MVCIDCTAATGCACCTDVVVLKGTTGYGNIRHTAAVLVQADCTTAIESTGVASVAVFESHTVKYHIAGFYKECTANLFAELAAVYRQILNCGSTGAVAGIDQEAISAVRCSSNDMTVAVQSKCLTCGSAFHRQSCRRNAINSSCIGITCVGNIRCQLNGTAILYALNSSSQFRPAADTDNTVGRAAARRTARRAAARSRSSTDGLGLASFYGLIARLDAGNAAAGCYLGTLAGDGNIVRVGLYVRYLAVARYLGACRRYGDSADGCVLFDGQGSLIGNSNIAYRAGQGQIGLRGHSADAAARYRDRRRAVRAADQHALSGRGILDADRVRTAADDDAAGNFDVIQRHLVRAVRDDEVAVDGHAGERCATLADDHVALDCLAGDALCADIGCRHAGDDLGEFRASDVVLQVQHSVRAVDIAACDQRRNALGRPRGYRAAVNKVLQRGAAAALERKGARQNSERLLTGDRCIRVQQAICALERAHLDCLAHIAVIPCARQYVSVVVQRRRLSRAEGTGDDRRHLCAGQQTLRVNHTVRAVQQAIVDRLLERLRGPVVREILVLTQVGSKGIARQEHRACQHHCNGVFTLHFSIPPFVRQS